MKALVYIFNNADYLSSVLEVFSERGINGCTIFSVSGMARELSKRDDFSSMFGTLRLVLKPNLKDSKALLLIIEEGRVADVVSAIESVTGSLEKPETGVLFTLPIDYVRGIKL